MITLSDMTQGTSDTFRISAREMRHANLGNLLSIVRSAETIPRSELAARTGLTIPTVHRLLAELLQMGFVEEDHSPSPARRSGRRPTWYRFRADICYVVSVDIGNETTRAALASADGAVVAVAEMKTPQIAGHLIEGVASLILRLHANNGGHAAPLVGVAVGLSASVSPETGVVLHAPHYHGWEGMQIRTLLEQRVGCRVFVEQDDHLSIVGEVGEGGAAHNVASTLVLNVGKGIGVGHLIDGQVLRGHHGAAGRIADWPLRLVGIEDHRTVSDVLVADAMVATYHRRGGTLEVFDGRSLCAVARANDEIARSVVEEAAAVLGRIFWCLALDRDPEVMIFGGGLAESFDLFAQPLNKVLASLPFTIEVIPSMLGDQAVVRGGIPVALQGFDEWVQERLTA